MVIGRVVMMHIDDDVLGKDGFVDPAKIDTVGRMGGQTYTRTKERFDMAPPVPDNKSP